MTQAKRRAIMQRRSETAARLTDAELRVILERNIAEYNDYKAEKRRAKYDSENEPFYAQRERAAARAKDMAAFMETCKIWINVCRDELAKRETA